MSSGFTHFLLFGCRHGVLGGAKLEHSFGGVLYPPPLKRAHLKPRSERMATIARAVIGIEQICAYGSVVAGIKIVFF